MRETVLDTVGMRCPQPLLKLAVSASLMQSGDVLVVSGDCPTFEHDVREWCRRLNKTLISAAADAHGVVTVRIVL